MKLSTPHPHVQQHAQQARLFTLALLLVLVVSIAVDHFYLRDISHWQVWLLQTTLLCVNIPGILQSRARSAIWLCFLLMFYFLLYIDRCAEPLHRGIYIFMSLLVLTLFTSTMLFARWQAQADRVANTTTQESCDS
ncbi:MAG TPA: DUF2069 domain-containing protein [Pseudomonadales bacterium]|nr:DUF2069 domain-containing protein [Pseudomonadales bacterium]